MADDFSGYPATVELRAEGHLIDSGIMSAIMDTIIKNEGVYKIHEFVVGHTHQDPTRTRFQVFARTADDLDRICLGLHGFGCIRVSEEDAVLQPAERDWVVPEDFYSTTNHLTEVRIDGKWIPAGDTRMDTMIVCRREGGEWKAWCRKLRDVHQGDLVVCGFRGIRIHPEFKERDREEFAFMNSEVSSERRVRIAVRKIARLILDRKKEGRRIGVTAGPVVVHTGGADFLCRMIRDGYVDFILSGNALAVHDIEQSLYKTSLGIDINSGEPVENGHRNHLRAINAIYRHRTIEGAVKAGALTSGIFYECVKKGVPFVLSGSIRDDGPLPEVITDMNQAQKAYFAQLHDCGLMLILSTMLHGIGVGNMLPGFVKTICVDINPAVVTKLADRGSHQTVGIVTDVGSFLQALHQELENLKKA